MNHTAKCQLLILMDENPDHLTPDQLADYIWLVEQQLQELRQRQAQRRVHYAQDNPIL